MEFLISWKVMNKVFVVTCFSQLEIYNKQNSVRKKGGGQDWGFGAFTLGLTRLIRFTKNFYSRNKQDDLNENDFLNESLMRILLYQAIISSTKDLQAGCCTRSPNLHWYCQDEKMSLICNYIQRYKKQTNFGSWDPSTQSRKILLLTNVKQGLSKVRLKIFRK